MRFHRMLLRACTLASVCFALQAGPCLAQPSPGRPHTAARPAATLNADPELNRLITGLVLKHMPHSYSRDKDWGKQAERWDGIEWDFSGGRIHAEKRRKMVNHGTWRRYSAELLDPRRQFDVTVTNIRNTRDQKLAFRVNFATRLKLFARQAEWVKGVQMYSLSAEGRAAVRLSVDITMSITMDPTQFPPGIVFTPRCTAADLIVDDFRIDRVSKLGGEFAQQVTRLARREMEEEIVEKEAELVEKINKEFDENADDLHLSLADALSSQWAERVTPFLPPGVKQAVDEAGK